MLKRTILISFIFVIIMSLLAPPSCSFSGKRYKFFQESMEPTLHSGDWVTMSPVNRELKRGDIVFYAVPNSTSGFIKRIIGLPGETLEVKDGQVYIDGSLLEEPYVMEQGKTSMGKPILIPEGHYFVMGDNRMKSSDSRDQGPIPTDNITGILKN